MPAATGSRRALVRPWVGELRVGQGRLPADSPTSDQRRTLRAREVKKELAEAEKGWRSWLSGSATGLPSDRLKGEARAPLSFPRSAGPGCTSQRLVRQEH